MFTLPWEMLDRHLLHENTRFDRISRSVLQAEQADTGGRVWRVLADDASCDSDGLRA